MRRADEEIDRSGPFLLALQQLPWPEGLADSELREMWLGPDHEMSYKLQYVVCTLSQR